MENNVKTLSRLIEQKTGIIYADHNLYQLENRVKTVMTEFNFKAEEDFYNDVLINPRVLEKILDLATNNETSFFRDPGVFEGITSFVIPEILKVRPVGALKVWSAACSKGQEPYSIIMQLENNRNKFSSVVTYSLTCTDISKRVLDQGRSGIYSSLEVDRGLSVEDKNKYFVNVGSNQWQVRPEFRKYATFQQLNLLDTTPLRDSFDIISCRNVLIYQNVENKKKIISELAKKLNPGGFLILGGAESLFGLSDDFVTKEHNRHMFHQRK